MKNELKNKDNFIIYTTDDNNIDVEVYLEDENLWMTQEQISRLFDKAKSTINEHIKHIYEEGELKEEFSTKPTNYYNRKILDIYATSVDYDAKNEQTRKFFKTVQNKMHYAVHGNYACYDNERMDKRTRWIFNYDA